MLFDWEAAHRRRSRPRHMRPSHPHRRYRNTDPGFVATIITVHRDGVPRGRVLVQVDENLELTLSVAVAVDVSLDARVRQVVAGVGLTVAVVIEAVGPGRLNAQRVVRSPLGQARVWNAPTGKELPSRTVASSLQSRSRVTTPVAGS